MSDEDGRGSNCLVCLGGLALLVASLALALWHKDYPARADGLLAESYVEKVTTATRRGGSRSSSSEFRVSYSFHVDGRPYQREQTISRKPTQREVTVFYDPANPERSSLGPVPALGETGQKIALVAAFVGLLIAATKRPLVFGR